MRTAKGFTLIEVMMALVILLVAIDALPPVFVGRFMACFE